MLFNLVVSLYTSRVMLQVLGITDLGIYQVVAGVVALFIFTSGSLAGATSRFLTFELGRNDTDKLKRTFAATLNAHLIEASLIFVACETVGLWFVGNKLVIPNDRMDAAQVVYQCAVIMTVLSIIQIPYNSSIIAHEKMNVFAYIGILDTLLKLAACYIVYAVPFDKLIVYGIALLSFSVLIQSIYLVYCRRYFVECRFKWFLDWEIAKPILTFSGWELISSIAGTAKNQGINILLNLFFGVVLNAACGFANTVYGAISGFANNFMVSIRPAITKAYSVESYGRVNDLITTSSKYAFCLMLLLSAPFFYESDFILKLWLKNPPDWTSAFCKLQLATLLIAVIFFSVRYAINATGHNKGISIVDSTLYFVLLPIAYFLLRMGLSPLVPFVLMVGIEVIKSNTYSFLLRRVMPEFSLSRFYMKSVLPCVVVFFIVAVVSYPIYKLFDADGWSRFLLTCTTTTVITSIMIFFYIMDRYTRSKIIAKIIAKWKNH